MSNLCISEKNKYAAYIYGRPNAIVNRVVGCTWFDFGEHFSIECENW